MIDKEKIQNILKNIVALIMENNDLYFKSLRQINKQFHSNYETLSANISDIYYNFTNYQLKTDLDTDQLLKLKETKERKFEEEIRKLKEVEDQFEFLVGQSKLDTEKRNSLIKDIIFMIEDL